VNDNFDGKTEFKPTENLFLLNDHQKIFLQSNVAQTLSLWFTEHPASDCPFLYKVLLMMCQKGWKFEARKTLLAEVTEILPCLCN